MEVALARYAAWRDHMQSTPRVMILRVSYAAVDASPTRARRDLR